MALSPYVRVMISANHSNSEHLKRFAPFTHWNGRGRPRFSRFGKEALSLSKLTKLGDC